VRVLVPSRTKERHPEDQWGGARLLIGEAGKESLEVPAERASSWFGAWTPDGKGVFYIDGGHRKEPGYSVRRFDLATGKTEVLHENKDRLGCLLRLSHDGKRLAWCDFPVKDDEVRVVVLTIDGRKAVESEPFHVDDAGSDGVHGVHWDAVGQGVFYARTPPGGARNAMELWRFDVAAAKSALFPAGRSVDACILGPVDKNQFFALTRTKGAAPSFILTRDGERIEMPAGYLGIAAAGGQWLVLDLKKRSLVLAKPEWKKK
jgi:hypothetical protein